ncbi:hypothetical protein [Beijerinckia sp. L45]|uniref:hypothetical protein n=1 Tax=Beijerinckia sp. L45 TaxID=1641855 RepID=UPI00131CD43A|nr:hypothetical protein [Beijerinckia sp. L45]
MTDALARDLRLCRNFLCILHSLDRHELIGAGVLHPSDLDGWLSFRDGPYRAYLALDSAREEKCFTLVQTRLTPELRADTRTAA